MTDRSPWLIEWDPCDGVTMPTLDQFGNGYAVTWYLLSERAQSWTWDAVLDWTAEELWDNEWKRKCLPSETPEERDEP